MNSNAEDLYLLFRRTGSEGIVIFERDEVLPKGRHFLRDVLLGDINNEILELRYLREQNVIFGFISYQDGAASSLSHLSNYAAVTVCLTSYFGFGGASPDFWLACGSKNRQSALGHRGHDPMLKPEVGMILRATDWYGRRKDSAVFISGNPEAKLVAKGANIVGIHYPRWWSGEAPLARGGMAEKTMPPSDVTAARALVAAIEGAIAKTP